ncbi:tetratricopeptide repeat protein [Shewanella nanhaiensis]|uniref:Nitrite reductase n=1 Tax=Shewanella nanhaiensis TaxID=2864872 RepID=A0ABS7DZS3_9GAMM|nr:tetratricopeptide repeat protein [Shewanella nanhaiensis]MBW8182867.1 nitrite reductase [Shewanella nanhaiensis]
MNSLAVGIVISLSVPVVLIWRHHLQSAHLLLNETAVGDGSYHPAQFSFGEIKVPAAVTIIFLISCLSLYAQVGRFGEWDKGVVDENIDYLIAADINKNARKVSEQPKSEIALLNLAQSYIAGGMYSEAINSLDELIALSGEAADLLGMKASAMYYRDNRTMSLDTELVLARALALDKFEFQSRLLKATHAYLNGQYEQAIEQWQLLLQSESQSFNRASINNAIFKAEQKVADRS